MFSICCNCYIERRIEYNYPAKIDDWKTFEKSNPTIGLNILYTKENKYVQLILKNITQPVKNRYFC